MRRQRPPVLPEARPLHWIGSSREDIRSLPGEVCDRFGFALRQAQMGLTPASATPLQGFGGAGVVELVEDYDTNTFRAVYTVRFRDVVYVLHIFQKKSKRGRETPREDMNIIRARLKEAEEEYRRWIQARGGERDGGG